MKYFLPITPDPAQAEYLRDGVRAILEDRGLPTEPRRIQSLWFHAEGEPRVLQVGVDDSDTGEPVLLILRAANAPFYWVLTPLYGIMAGTPMAIAAGGGTISIDFEDTEPRLRRTRTRARRRRPRRR